MSSTHKTPRGLRASAAFSPTCHLLHVFLSLLHPSATQLRTYRKSDLSADELTALLARPRIDFTSILNTVSGGPVGIRV